MGTQPCIIASVQFNKESIHIEKKKTEGSIPKS